LALLNEIPNVQSNGRKKAMCKALRYALFLILIDNVYASDEDIQDDSLSKKSLAFEQEFSSDDEDSEEIANIFKPNKWSPRAKENACLGAMMVSTLVACAAVISEILRVSRLAQ
jgi:hypothetical protein